LHVVDVGDGRFRQTRIASIKTDIARQSLQMEATRERDDQERPYARLSDLVRLHDNRRPPFVDPNPPNLAAPR